MSPHNQSPKSLRERLDEGDGFLNGLLAARAGACLLEVLALSKLFG